MAARTPRSGYGSSASNASDASVVAVHSASISGSSSRVFAVSDTIRCRASAPGSRPTSPARFICATVWLAAECVTPISAARSRMASGPRASRARTTGEYRGR
jgi:hypothetical protein